MKKLKQALCLVLAAGLLFVAGCSAKPSSSSSSSPTGSGETGRFVEKDITPDTPKGIRLLFSQGSNLVGFDQNFTTRYESTDNGDTWQTSPGPAQQNPDQAALFEDVGNATLTPEGTLLLSITPTKPGSTVKPQLLKVSKDGTIEPFALADFDSLVEKGIVPQVMIMQGLAGEKLFLNFSWDTAPPQAQPSEETAPAESTAADTAESTAESENQQMVTSNSFASKSMLLDVKTGQSLSDLNQWSGFSFAFNKDNLYLSNFDGTVDIYSLSTNQKTKTITPEFKVGDNDYFYKLAADEEGNLYRLGGTNLQKSNPEGKEVTPLFDTSSYSLGAPNSFPLTFNAPVAQNFFVSLPSSDGESTRLYRYTFDKDFVADPTKTLSIWSLEENPLVRAAISEFKRTHPEAQINYEVALSQGGQTAEDAIRNLNTRLLAGDGPDILLLDGLAVENYVKKGLLKDLSSVVPEGTLYENLRTPFKTDSGNFVLPARFTLPALIGQPESLAQAKTFEDFIKFATSGPDYVPSNAGSIVPPEQKPHLLFSTAKEFFGFLWKTSANKIVADNKLDSQALRQFLEAAKALAEKNKLTSQDSFNQLGGMGFSLSNGGMTVIEGSPNAFLSGQAKTGALSVDDIMMLWYVLSSSGITETEVAPFPGMVENAWNPAALTSINAKTKVAELADDFVKTMFSPTVQGASVGGGLPVTPEGAKILIDNVNKTMAQSQNLPFNYDLAQTVSNLKNPVLADAALAEKFQQTTLDYCFGKLSIDDAVGKIEQDVRNYLAERQ